MEGDINAEWEANFINSLGSEVVRECASGGLHTTQETVLHLVKLKLLNPRNGFYVSKPMPRELTQKFVRSCVNDLMRVAPDIDCIRMQAYWTTVSPKLDEVKLMYNAQLMEKSQAAFDEILDDEEENLLRKIAAFANVYTNIGNGNVPLNIKETMHPLKSVFKQKQIKYFSSLTRTEKFEYLKYVARLVSGIRIYQQYYKKGSENIDNAPLLLANASSSILNAVTILLDKLSKRIKLLVKELRFIYTVIPGTVKKDLPAGFGAGDCEELQHIHHIMLQQEIYLKEIFTYMKNFNDTIQLMTRNFEKKMEELQKTIGTREVIPTNEVYGQFANICDEWTALQTESCYLICVGLIVKNLHMMNKYFPLARLEVALGSIEEELKIADNWDKNRNIATDNEETDVELVIPADETLLQFRGYCALTLITTNGALLPAKPGLGILKFENKFYGFSTTDAALSWLENPGLNIKRAYEVIRGNPQLVHLLDAYDFLHGFRTAPLVTDGEGICDTKQDRFVQTVVHPLCTFRDKDYTFSEWQHKYKALQLSRMVKCVTKSVQTSNHSHFRASIAVQCEPNKTRGTEPKKDIGCVHESIRNYMWGLRGTNQFHHLSLTRPVWEICEKRKQREPCKSMSAERNELINALETEREYENALKKNNSIYSNGSL